MIRITRPSRAPRILTGTGAAERDKLCAQFDQEPDEYRTGRKKLTIRRTIYAAKSVKNALRTAQHGKCAFCESKVSAVAYGDIEHFRPKGGYQQDPTHQLKKPGYYWLGYEWTNLLFSCQICNQQGKKNVFPLARPSRRATSHHDDLAAEEPLLIDPATVDPEEYIGFREEVAYPRRGRRLGKITIEVLGLNREALREERRDYLVLLRKLQSVRELLHREIIANEDLAPESWLTQLCEIDAKLHSCKLDSAEYAAMARAALG